MTTEREMLEFAAKACGIEGVWQDGFGMCIIGKYLNNPGEIPRFWNPKDNSADCAAMCAKLGIDVIWFNSKFYVSCWNIETGDIHEYHNGTDDCKEAAWRYAATKVAAKIGGMK